MPEEVLAWLAPPAGGTVVDATVGLGGHAALLLDRLGPSGRLIGLDRDPAALALAAETLAARCRDLGWGPPDPWRLLHADFRDLAGALAALGHPAVDGILLDLGVSSLQLDEPGRGFSFRGEGPLDMRMDPAAPVTAADLVNTLPEPKLAQILWEYGEERRSRRIAARIAAARARRPLATTRELADLVTASFPPDARHGRLHPATRTFQALRIAVNDELAALDAVLAAAAGLLARPVNEAQRASSPGAGGTSGHPRSPPVERRGGRLVVLAYHSLEDRRVKQAFEYLGGKCRCPPGPRGLPPVCSCGARPDVTVLTRKPVSPSAEEIAHNPRARSARLRAIERL
jgi:16S rRNA (cytosine1402-N4)-methyltransferase